MVLAVCRHLLRRSHDADDAFQATFLVLVRKAGSIRVDESLAPWLCSVAYRTARRAREIAARYRPLDDPRVEEPAGSAPDDDHLDLRPVLHEELDRLPGKFRDVIVLCHLEGKSHEEAARVLRWPIGTVSSRLSRGRQLLRSRLERRGLEVVPAMLSANLLAGPPPIVVQPLLESTVAAAVGPATAPAVSALVLSLTRGVLKTMWLRKIRTASLALLLIGGTMGGLVWAHRPAAPRPSSADASVVAAATRAGDVAPAQKDAQPSLSSQSTGDQPCPTDCPVFGQDGPPEYCPITMATNAFSKMMGYFHSSSPSP
jgi:RNA polymerase sigma factor (sigma-70 family)